MSRVVQAVGSRRHFARPQTATVLGLACALALAACGSSTKSPSTAAAGATGIKGPSEVALQPTSTKSANPFTDPVGKDKGGVMPPAAAAGSGNGLASYRAGTPGLYGGTRDYATCDAQQLTGFLEQNPAKAQAWATTLRIQTSDIRSYISGLTPVILRTDTRITNHGYVGGSADPIQAVLEAGTAVFVDSYGRPVVKCYCGNPLTPPIAYAQPTYLGTPWSGFSTTNITIIKRSLTIIKVFRLYDPSTGMLFTRPAGTSGTQDGPYTQPSPSTPTQTGTTPSPGSSIPAPSTQTPTQTQTQTTGAPTPAPTESPSASFSPNPGTQGDTFTLSASGFAPNANLDVTLNRPDGVVEHYSIHTGGDGSGSYTFSNTQNVVTGTYNATITNTATGASASTSLDVSPSSANSGSGSGSSGSGSGSGGG